MSEPSQYHIDVLNAAFDVIECLSAHSGEMLTARQVALELGINRMRAFRILKTLRSRGYVEEQEPSGRFRLGFRFLALGSQIQSGSYLLKTAEPILIELAQNTGDVSYLMIRFGTKAMIVDRCIGQNQLQILGPVGEILSLNIGAARKTLLAFAPDAERAQILREMELPRWTQYTITDREELRRQVEIIRSQGYGLDEEETEIGTFAVGAPVFDHTGSTVASISVAVPGARYTTARRDELIPMVIRAGQTLSARLGYVNH